jgi:hypothetical protein
MRWRNCCEESGDTRRARAQRITQEVWFLPFGNAIAENIGDAVALRETTR